jgi:hypothetical protein
MSSAPNPVGKATDADAERLFTVLLGIDGKGQPRFSQEEILTYLPLLMASAGISLASSPAALAVFQRVAQIVGAKTQDTDAELGVKLADYFLKHPPKPGLQEAFAVFLRAEAGVITADHFQGFVSQVRADAATPVSISSTHPAYEVHEQKPRDPK